MASAITINEGAGVQANNVSVSDAIPADLSGFTPSAVTVTGSSTTVTNSSTATGGTNGDGTLSISNITVPANGTVRFEPRGYHLMCDSPNAKMKIGSKVGVLLKLSDGSSVAAGFVVKNAAGQ